MPEVLRVTQVEVVLELETIIVVLLLVIVMAPVEAVTDEGLLVA